jgi:hypothetical protein
MDVISPKIKNIFSGKRFLIGDRVIQLGKDGII